MCVFCFFFFKQKTAYEMRISDWSSDVCSSDLSGCPPASSCRACIDATHALASPERCSASMRRSACAAVAIDSLGRPAGTSESIADRHAHCAWQRDQGLGAVAEVALGGRRAHVLLGVDAADAFFVGQVLQPQRHVPAVDDVGGRSVEAREAVERALELRVEAQRVLRLGLVRSYERWGGKLCGSMVRVR